MITVEELDKAYGGQVLFEEISFRLGSRERCGLVGRNGSGKSTLLKIIAGIEEADGGKVSLPKGYKIGYLEQHIRFTMPTLVEEALLGLPPEEREESYRAEKMLFGLGFSYEDLERGPREFSGGYQLRIHLAKLLLSEPDLLLLDEPTNYLDILSIRFLERTLSRWQGEMMLISHDRQFMDRVITHTMGIHRNHVMKLEGTTEKYYAKLVLDEELHEKTRQKLEKKKAHALSFVERFGAKATKAAQAQSRLKFVEKLPSLDKLAQIYELDFSFREEEFPAQLMLEAKEIGFWYGQEKKEDAFLLENLSLAVEKGDRIAIIGKNGRGKSTILRLLAGDLEPKEGSFKLSSRLKVGYFGQTNIDRLAPERTIEEEISAANPTLPYGAVRSICGVMMFSGDLAKKKISVLSGGEKSRVLLGRILATPCNFLLLDEPTNHLDAESIEALLDAISSFAGAVILVTHSEMLLEQMPQKLLICHQNSHELFDGTYTEFLEKRGWDEEEAPKKEKKNKKGTPAPAPKKKRIPGKSPRSKRRSSQKSSK